MTAPSYAGRYRIEQIIGVGGFASVHLAHDDELRSPVAVKILADNWARQPDVRGRFLQEARLLRRADSHWLVQVFDIGELDDGRPYFVMTYADRGTLQERLSEGALPVEEALRLIGEIAQGVAVLHGIGVVHRDLKPSNVLFRSRAHGGERVMVADLGIARSTDHLTGLTLPAGSPGYMAPEQLHFDGAPDARADVHGLGALTYHMLTGQVPGRPEERVPPSALRPGVPPEVDEAVMRALSPDRDQRWPDAAAYLAALPIPGAAPTPVPAAPAPAPEPGAPAGRRKVVLGGGAAVAALAVAAAVAVSVSGQESPRAAGGAASATPAATRSETVGDPAGRWLRLDSDIPREYRSLIVQAGTHCAQPGLSPSLIAAMLKAESGFDPDLTDRPADEYGIARWTPAVLWHWQPGGLQSPKPSPPLGPELSILSMGRFMCGLGPKIEDIPGDPALNLAGLFRSGVDPMHRDNGVPERWRDYLGKVSKYMEDYRPR
ncbi:serine/threonine-protein kinase [Spongiactinospora rosea]|uniref:serine/threonine-protein kinase n=1 Tax=Spongiactinospora rosea TaxID=2248750 RepID=UPI0018F323FB|nr:serine/threonine-protein kinase [Spongiactinospora rosea]